MNHFQQIASGVPVTELLAQLDAHPELWDEHGGRKMFPGSSHTQMSDIWVRFNDVAVIKESGNYAALSDLHVPIWYQAWKKLPALHKIIFDLMACVDGEMLGGVLITRIPPGKGIAPHADDSWHVQYYDKLYVSLRSEDGAVFWCEHDGVKEGLSPKPGEVWLFDNRKPHWVTNESKQERITLIVCIRTEKFGRQLEEHHVPVS